MHHALCKYRTASRARRSGASEHGKQVGILHVHVSAHVHTTHASSCHHHDATILSSLWKNLYVSILVRMCLVYSRIHSGQERIVLLRIGLLLYMHAHEMCTHSYSNSISFRHDAFMVVLQVSSYCKIHPRRGLRMLTPACLHAPRNAHDEACAMRALAYTHRFDGACSRWPVCARAKHAATEVCVHE
jgi:hypothetical protein